MDSKAEEFIELYNASEESMDLSGWQLRYVSATSSRTLASPSFKIDVAASEGEALVLESGEHYLLYTQKFKELRPESIGQMYSGNLTESGSLVLFAPPDELTCGRTAVDALAWGDGNLGDGDPVHTGGSVKVIARYTLEEPGNEGDDEDDEQGLDVKTFGNEINAPDKTEDPEEDDSEADNSEEGDSAANSPKYVTTGDNLHDFGALNPGEEDAASPGELNGHLLPENPASSVSQNQTTGVVIAEDECDPSKPGGDDPGALPPPGDSPPAIIEDPPANKGSGSRPVIPASNIGLKSPVLSELLPNPAPPKTDKDDEFIELYNPNDKPFDLSGYILEVGLKTRRQYTIPAGAKIEPKSFLAFFSSQTKLALSNTSGQAVLLDPLGKVLAVSDIYEKAKDGHAWVFAEGKWQWTTKPTPNAINVVSAPQVKTSRSSNSKSTSSGSGVVGNSSGSGGASEDQDDELAGAGLTSGDRPLHPGLLALAAVFALLYGAYEYRHDLANKIHQLRNYRAARATARQSPKG